MQTPRRIYLAGPEVFFPAEEHRAIVAEKKRALREAGFEGVDPLDTDLEFSEDQTKPNRGHLIYQANRELMDSCDAIIANLTPFRGIRGSGGQLLIADQPGEHRLLSAELFNRCVRALANCKNY
ncbi:nucleoside 2-deoxyribosyltransferase [Marinobacter sp. PE14]